MSSQNSSNLSMPATARIAVLEDNPAERDQLVRVLEQAAGNRPVEVSSFASAEQLCASTARFDLLVLDILMNGTDGMEAARAIRARDSSAVLVFLTDSPDYVFMGYEVEAFRYFMKPLRDNEAKLILDKAFERVENRGLTVRTTTGAHRVPFASILYIEAQGRKSVIRLTDGEEIVALEGISEIEKRLGAEYLMRCQRSFIVNLQYITQIRRYEVVMRNGVPIPVGRRLWPEVQKRFLNDLLF